jgi:phytol kinase
MNWHMEIINATIIGGLFLLLFISAEIWRCFGQPKPESTRKLVHLGGGVVSLSLAYVLESHWSVLILCILFSTIIIYSKRKGLLQSVHGVQRKSSGGVYFPIAVYLTFLISSALKAQHFYFITILVLSVSDTLAALVGKTYGFKLYHVEKETRSLEGSIFFFLSTFILVHLGLLLLTQIGRFESVLVGLLIAILVTAFESVSLGGADNLFIPLGTLFMLSRNVTKSAAFLAEQFVLLGCITILVWLLCRRSKKLGSSGIIGLTLVAYASWAMVSFLWFIPVIIGIALVALSDRFLSPPSRTQGIHRIQRVFYVTVVPFLWILTANLFHPSLQHIFLSPYIMSITASFCILWRWNSIPKIDEEQQKSLPVSVSFKHGLILSAIFFPIQLLFVRELAPIFTIATGFISTLVADLIYWSIARQHFKSWCRITYLRMGLAVIVCVSLLLFAAQLLYYQPVNLILRLY